MRDVLLLSGNACRELGDAQFGLPLMAGVPLLPGCGRAGRGAVFGCLCRVLRCLHRLAVGQRDKAGQAQVNADRS